MEQIFPVQDTGRWLSGGSLIALAAGYITVWSLLVRLHQVLGKPGKPLLHPRLRSLVRRLRGPIFALVLAVVVGVRATRRGAAYTPSFMEEFASCLRKVAAIRGSLRFLVEDLSGVILVLAIVRHARGAWRVLSSPWTEKKVFIENLSFEILRQLPIVAISLEKQVKKTEAHLEATLRPQGGGPPLRSLPEKGRQAEEVLVEMRSLADAERSKWSGGKASGAVYNDTKEHASLVTNAYSLFSHSNPLHPDLWPSSLKFEREVISMTARLLDGGHPEVCGMVTSGGTESILMAAKAHRDFFRQRGILSPEIVAATSAHAGIEKACSLMGIRLVQVPVDPKTMKADVRTMARAMSPNTILIYASAPSYPHGVIDPVEALGKLATQYGCGLHVDCCLGGFVLPFARRLGYPVPAFDFGVPGVTSISADTHKYGYAPKGTSVALFRDSELRHQAYFCFPEWSGGLYATPTVAGSRPGALTAACWAAMVSMGEDGYRGAVKSIMDTVKEVAEGISSIPGLTLIGEAKAMVVCFGGESEVNIYKVGDNMRRRGWSLNSLQSPSCLHLCVTLCHAGKAPEFLEDLKASTAETTATGYKADDNSTAAIYGMASSMPAGPVNVLLRAYTDVTLGK